MIDFKLETCVLRLLSVLDETIFAEKEIKIETFGSVGMIYALISIELFRIYCLTASCIYN